MPRHSLPRLDPAVASGTYVHYDGTNLTQGGTTIPVSGGGTSPDATSTTKGLVQLTGDLGGTAAAPTVPGLAAKVDSGVTGISDVTGLLGPILKPPPRQTGTLITAWQSGHGWSVTGTGATSNLNDTSTFVWGSQSASGTSNGAGAATNMRHTALPAQDLTNKSIRLLLRVDGLAHLNSLSVYIGDTALANFNLVTIYSPGDGKTLIDNQWCWLEFNFTGAAATGTPNKAAVTDWQIRWTDDSTAPVTIHFGALCLTKNSATFPNGVVSITFDDTYVSQATVAAPILDASGFPASLMTIADQVGYDVTKLSLVQLQNLVKWHGWEVAGHAYTAANHNAGFTNITSTALENELRALKAWLVANGFGQYDYLAWPSGLWNETVEAIASRHFASARTIVPGPQQVLPLAHPFRVRSKSVSNTTTTAQVQTLVDQAYTAGNWLNLTFHNVTASPTLSTDYSTTNFQTIVSYLQTKGIPVVTYGDVLRTAI